MQAQARRPPGGILVEADLDFGRLVAKLEGQPVVLRGVKDALVKLTDREFRLLLELVKHPGEVMTHERLLRAVWGDESIGEVQYLRVTFARIRRKLEQCGLDGGVIAAYSSVGYLITEPD